MEDDITRQVDEIESLSSIYDKQWKAEDEAGQSYSVNITDTVILYVTLPINYPSEAPPTYQISAPELSHEEKTQISRILEETYLENVGETVVFQWIEAIRSYLNNKSEFLENSMSVVCIAENDNESEASYLSNVSNITMTVETQIEPSKITHGEIIMDRKSTFQGHASKVSSVDEVKQVLSILYENKKIANATHNIYAYRILKDGKYIVQDCEDDGESQAGKRLLQLLQMTDLTDVLVVVSRWYGGIHLGPDRFRHISNAARQVLISAGFIKQK